MSEVSYGGGEQPHYTALRRTIDGYYLGLLAAMAQLRSRVFRLLPLPDPGKGADDPPFLLTQATSDLIDEAVAIFLAEMAGPNRTREGFSENTFGREDGVIQQRDLFAYQIGLTRGADLLDARQTVTVDRQSPAVKEMLEHAFDRLSEKGALRLESVKDDIHGVLASAQDAGLNPLETARQLSAQFDEYSGWEFQRLARTEAAFASEAGVRDQMQELGVEQVEWLLSDGACPICEDLAAGGPYAVDDDDNLPPGHPNCCVGGTVVSGPAVLVSMTRWFVGEVVEIVTAGGRNLTVTPNHPVLTPEGWVAAGLLNEGGQVICGSGAQWGAAKVYPDDYQIPALIEEVAAAVGRAGRVSTASVPTTAEDFHGDGGGSEVCVIRTNGELRHCLNAPLFQPFAEQYLCRRHAEALGLPGGGALTESFPGVFAAPSGGVGEGGKPGVLLGGALGRRKDERLGHTAPFHAVGAEDASNHAATNDVPDRKSLLTFAGQVAADDILFIQRRAFSGHVYNLQTIKGWYTANSIITHNCLCSTSPVIPDDTQPETPNDDQQGDQ